MLRVRPTASCSSFTCSRRAAPLPASRSGLASSRSPSTATHRPGLFAGDGSWKRAGSSREPRPSPCTAPRSCTPRYSCARPSAAGASGRSSSKPSSRQLTLPERARSSAITGKPPGRPSPPASARETISAMCDRCSTCAALSFPRPCYRPVGGSIPGWGRHRTRSSSRSRAAATR